MTKRAACRPFPFCRLGRLTRAEVELARRMRLRARLEALGGVAFDLARRVGLGGAALSLVRVEGLALEDVRRAFPGCWRFAVLSEPLAGRLGFLSLEGAFLSQIEQRLSVPREEMERGRDGLLAWLVCRGLESLGEEAAGWRFCGVAASAGELGRLCRGGDRLGAAWIRISAGFAPGRAVWLEPEESLARAPRAAAEAGVCRDVPVRLSLRLGETELTAEEAGGMRPGDVVCYSAESGELHWLMCGGLRLGGRLEGTRFRLQHWSLEPQGGDMGEIHMDEGRTVEALALEGLPVPVSIEAGSVQLTVGELSALRCGDVIVLSDPLLAPVNVRAGSRLLGRGELVDVEGRRGVRLLEVVLAGAGHADAA